MIHRTIQSLAESCRVKSHNYLEEHSHILIDQTGALASSWLLAAKYIADIHNIYTDPTIRNQVLLTMRTEITKDISVWLQFCFWHPILYIDLKKTWLAFKDRTNRRVGIAETIGGQHTCWILDEQSKQLISRSVIKSLNSNRRAKQVPELIKEGDSIA